LKIQQFQYIFFLLFIRIYFENFNLRPGSQFSIDEYENGILLKPVEDEPNLKEKKGVLFFSGKSIGNIESMLDKVEMSEFIL